MANIFQNYGFKNLKIEIESKIPKNLGSSSATFAALSLAVLKILGKNPSKKEVSNFALQGDIISHGGIPSGIDNSTVTFGGYIKYRKSKGIQLLKLDFKCPLIIVDSKKPENTSDTVLKIKSLKEKNHKWGILF